jgi:hypothetical protein
LRENILKYVENKLKSKWKADWKKEKRIIKTNSVTTASRIKIFKIFLVSKQMCVA